MMDAALRTHYDNLLYSADKDARFAAYDALFASVEQPVDWAYAVWDEMLARLTHQDNHQRSVAAQLLCYLAQSDPEKRILRDFARVIAVTKDVKFVTARHTLQSIWRVGLAGPEQRALAVEGLSGRFIECVSEKNGSLIRYDIAQALRHLYDATQDERIRERALALIATEEDEKYRKKYLTVWKKS